MDMTHPRLEHPAPPAVTFRPRLRYRPRLPARLLAWWQSAELDRRLAAGVPPAASAALTLRARAITGPRTRRRLADGLVRARRSARDAGPGLSAAIRPNAEEVLAARVVLSALVRRLETPEPVTARGLAMLRTLLTDGNSVLYAPQQRGALGSRLRAVAAALEPPDRRSPNE
jgi:hypothetical protein